MAIINPGLVGASQHLVRALEHQARQAVSSTISSAIRSATDAAGTSPSPAPSLVPSSTPASPATTTGTAINGGTSSPGGNGGPGSGGGGSSSPLLFFVALGFGVVFTNLWIIVGVKYCFRYNARNRQMRMAAGDGEPIDLQAVPRPHRRRREKKLMTMEEVNEKFPMVKYKTWVAGRAREGLPTQGGVSASASRAASLRDADGVVPELPSKERDSVEERPATSETSNVNQEKRDSKHQATESTSNAVAVAAPELPASAPTTPAAVPTADPLPRATSMDYHDHDHSDDEDDHVIDAALPPEFYGSSGDTCAICLDTLEDDDDVRGLTCGHAFHAVCLDPWLTSRRACCPLCKADYYTPKPRLAAGEVADGTTGVITVTLPGDPRTNRMNMPPRPSPAWMSFGGRGRGRPFAPMRFMGGGGVANTAAEQNVQPNVQPQEQQQPVENSSGRQFGFLRSRRAEALAAENAQTEPRGFLGNLRLPGRRRAQDGEQAQAADASSPPAAGASQEVTPSQLEAGTGTAAAIR